MGIRDRDNALFRQALDKVILPKNSDQVLKECIAAAKAGQLKKRQQEILDILSLLTEDEGDREKADALTIELMELQRTMQNIKI